MSQAYKICPICDTPNHRNASLCSTCGTTLINVPTVSDKILSKSGHSEYVSIHGETDLLEGNLRWQGSTYIVATMMLFVVIGCVATVILGGTKLLNSLLPPITPIMTSDPQTLMPTSASAIESLVTNTPRPTLQLATITIGPPTSTYTEIPTITPTLGPCVQQVQPNDSLIGIIARCGHRDYQDLMQTVLDMNNLTDPNQIQVGKSIEVPWPTSTPDPNVTITLVTTSSDGVSNIEGDIVALMDATGSPSSLRVRPTETLQPGVTWHRVTGEENIISIAVEYGATLRILSELNPEITFSQCDFGVATGGPGCTVLLYPGQTVRVPSPTVTPTIQPTPSGSETPTPSATPTYNVPTALSPSDRAFFRKDDLITLRWLGSGALGPDEVYLVLVEDLSSGQIYTEMTKDLSFIIPMDWQSKSNDRHDYVWSIAIVKQSEPDKPSFTTPKHLFTWQGSES